MIPAHAPTVAPRDRRPSPPARRGQGNSPEPPTPDSEQSATIPFAAALRMFQLRHQRRVDQRHIAIEAAMQADLQRENARAVHSGERVYVSAVEFFAWTRTRHTMPTVAAITARFSVCRATAYRWLDAYRRGMGLS